jgi:hypothetical protein
MISDGYEILRTAVQVSDQSRMYVKVNRKKFRKQAVKMVPAAAIVGGLLDGAAGAAIGNVNIDNMYTTKINLSLRFVTILSFFLNKSFYYPNGTLIK